MPAEFDFWLEATPVLTLSATTTASGTLAPLASSTSPETTALFSCANAARAQEHTKSRNFVVFKEPPNHKRSVRKRRRVTPLPRPLIVCELVYIHQSFKVVNSWKRAAGSFLRHSRPTPQE